MSRSTSATAAQTPLRTGFCILLLLAIGSYGPLFAQTITNDFYRIKLIQTDGKWVRGFVGDVTDSTFTVNATDEAGQLSRRTSDDKIVALVAIKRAIIKQASKKKARLRGAIAGGILAGFVVINNRQKNQTSSSVLTSFNMVLAIGVGVLAGTLAGHLIGNTRRIVVRPRGSDPETIARSMKLQLEPFSYEYQQRLIKSK